MPLPMFREKSPSPENPKSSDSPSTNSEGDFSLSGNKIHFISLGCPRNLVDTEVMLGILLKAGYEPTEYLNEADHIVINTCGFLQASRDEAMETLKASLHHRKKGAKIIVTGCMVQSHRDEILKKFPKVDYLLGSGDVEEILHAVESSEPGTSISSTKSYLEAGEVPRQLSTPQHYAYLKIAEGCKKRCAYCIIPQIKGPLKSKGVEQILKEFRVLLQGGAREIILIAQDLGDWGKDLGFRRSEGLLHLLKEILAVPGNYWLRLLYLYPDEISDDLIQLMKSDERICPYLDIPIQHVNNDILKMMHRATSKEAIVAIITKLKTEIPDIHIRTSLMVGFPGETEAQFEELADFLQKHPLDHVGVFKYSREEGSAAASLPKQVPEKVKVRRYKRLMKIQEKVAEQNNTKHRGRQVEAIVEGYHPESPLLMCGRHKGQCPEIDGQIIINDVAKVAAFGERYLVEITDIAGHDLVGSVVEALENHS